MRAGGFGAGMLIGGPPLGMDMGRSPAGDGIGIGPSSPIDIDPCLGVGGAGLWADTTPHAAEPAIASIIGITRRLNDRCSCMARFLD
jgi:hypothetical protein